MAVAGVLQVVLLWIGVRRTGARLRFGWPRLTKDVRQVLVIAIPGAIAGGATQLNTLVSQVLVGSDQGARAALYNADRLYQLPLGLIGVAIGLSLVPRLSKMFVANDTAGAKQAMDEGLVLSMAFTLPAAAAFLTIPFFIMDATLTRGLYTSEDWPSRRSCWPRGWFMRRCVWRCGPSACRKCAAPCAGNRALPACRVRGKADRAPAHDRYPTPGL